MPATKKQKIKFVLPDSHVGQRGEVLYIRLRPEDKAAIREAATEAGYASLSDYVLQVLREVVARR